MDQTKIEEFLTRGVAEIIDRGHLEARLNSGEKLRVKMGIDPTSPNIHLGRAVALLKLRELQEMGHEVFLIIGDFTGTIGDTSDKDSERPMLDEGTVRRNMSTYLEQVYKILDPAKTKVFCNSLWLSRLDFRRIGELSNHFSLAEFMARENIKKRFDTGRRISLRELLYPLMQGYDSIMVDADLEIGGTDQRFNMLAGRELQQKSYLLSDEEGELQRKNIAPAQVWNRKKAGQSDRAYRGPQDVVMVDLIPGTDKRKMSSSWGNTINLTDEPNDMFGKVMSIPDDLIGTYFVHCTRVPLSGIKSVMDGVWSGELNPRDAKMRLAREIVVLYHDADAAEAAATYFVETFSKGIVPGELKELYVSDGDRLTSAMVTAQLATSRADARRKVEQGGVELGGERILEYEYVLTSDDDGKVLRVGKKSFRRVSVR